MSEKKPRVRPASADAPSRIERELSYLTSGSSALAPQFIPDDDEDQADAPAVADRTMADRDAADQRAAERAASREAGRVDMQARRRLRVAPPVPVAIARVPFVAMLLVLVVAGVVGILVLTAKINANQFRLNNLQSQQAGLDAQEQAAKQTLNQKSSPGSLIAAAKKLGLVPAGSLAYIQLPDGRIVGVPQPALKTPSVSALPAPSAGSSPSSPSTPPATPTPSH